MTPPNGSLRQKTSFFYAFFLLPREKRRALECLYRFCWAADELSDNNDPLELKKKNLVEFKKKLTRCFEGKSKDPLFKNLVETFQRFHLSKNPLLKILEGVGRDLRPLRFKTFGELHRYCLQVAGGPGLASMEIFGFKDKSHRAYAENLGVFLQLINMTRDYREDLSLNRQYFPAEDFKKFHLIPGAGGETKPQWSSFVEFQLDRAWLFWIRAKRALTRRQRSELATAEAIAAVYVKLFKKLKKNPQKILQGKISLSRWDKILSVAGAACLCFFWRWADG